MVPTNALRPMHAPTFLKALPRWVYLPMPIIPTGLVLPVPICWAFQAWAVVALVAAGVWVTWVAAILVAVQVMVLHPAGRPVLITTTSGARPLKLTATI